MQVYLSFSFRLNSGGTQTTAQLPHSFLVPPFYHISSTHLQFPQKEKKQNERNLLSNNRRKSTVVLNCFGTPLYCRKLGFRVLGRYLLTALSPAM